VIHYLKTQDIGPTRELEFQFASRINMLTGDNGLGKTFVLDLLWWTLTSTWVGERAFPWRPPPFPELPEGDGYGIPEYQLGDRTYSDLHGGGG